MKILRRGLACFKNRNNFCRCKSITVERRIRTGVQKAVPMLIGLRFGFRRVHNARMKKSLR